ncbi:MAG: ATP synthase subunit I [Syntrophobacteraceae bacterium]|nr:ATP synthase subunit I [Syntrophobacteraceae bacterium]
MRDYLTSEALRRRVEAYNLIFLVTFPLAAWVLASGGFARGVLVGAIISTLSFRILKWQLGRALETPGRIPRKGAVLLSYYARFLGTLVVVFLAVHYRWAEPIPFVVGLSVVVLSIMLVGGQEFYVMLRKKGES